MSKGAPTFLSLNDVAAQFRDIFENGIPQKDKPNRLIQYILLFAYNGTGKTRLSTAFKDLGKEAVYLMSEKNELLLDEDGEALLAEEPTRDTLYFNAFTEDLFYWNNDLENDTERVLLMNTDSRFFDGLQELEMENRIGPLLERYADFNFKIDYEAGTVEFSRSVLLQDGNGMQDGSESSTARHIKVSRGEENIFIWCFFLAVAQLAIDGQETYGWVKYIYIDDPISSLDDNNAIAVASHLSQLLKQTNGNIKTVISTHHALFFNVMWNELNEYGKKNTLQPFFLNCHKNTGSYSLRYTNNTPFFHHVALLKQLKEAADSDQLYTYHFNMLRSILEKTATFHGFPNFSACIKKDKDDEEGILHARLINVLSHGNYSLFEPREMLEENKQYFKKILKDFMDNYRFNPELFPAMEGEG